MRTVFVSLSRLRFNKITDKRKEKGSADGNVFIIEDCPSANHWFST